MGIEKVSNYFQRINSIFHNFFIEKNNAGILVSKIQKLKTLRGTNESFHA